MLANPSPKARIIPKTALKKGVVNLQIGVTKITNMARKLQISVLFVNLNTQIIHNDIQKSFIDNKIRYL